MQVPRHQPALTEARPSQSMASPMNSVPAANSASGNAANSSPQNSGRPSLRSSGAKGDGRRQSGSPADSGQRYVSTMTTPLHFVSHLSCPYKIAYQSCPIHAAHASSSILVMATFGTPQPVCKIGARAFRLGEHEHSCAWNCVSILHQLVFVGSHSCSYRFCFRPMFRPLSMTDTM